MAAKKDVILAMVDIEKLSELTKGLKGRRNEAFRFFESILRDIADPDLANDALERLASCYSIVQHANFTYDEERLLIEIIAKI